MALRPALYLRVSTNEQTVDAQECELRQYCERRGWSVVAAAVFRDEVSGVAATRPGWEQLMQAVRRGRVDCVIVYKLDRVGRSLVHLAMILDELGRLTVPLICTSQGIDTSHDNPVGRLQLGVLMAVAEFERSLIRERTKAGLVAARARGAKIGRPERAAKFREEILRLRAEGLSYHKIGERCGLSVGAVHRLVKLAALQQPSPEKDAA